MSRSEEAAKKLAEALDIPEDQVLPCVVAFACLRYHGKSFVRKLANGTGPITTWRKTAEFVAKYFRKGQRVIIASGRIRVDPYTDKDGNKRTRFEVVADEVEFAESRRAAEDQPAGSLAAGYMENEGFAEIDGEDGELPF